MKQSLVKFVACVVILMGFAEKVQSQNVQLLYDT